MIPTRFLRITGSTLPLFVIELSTVPLPCSVDPGWTLTEVALSEPPILVVAPDSCVYVPLTVSDPPARKQQQSSMELARSQVQRGGFTSHFVSHIQSELLHNPFRKVG
jgi:hypothetical protein